MNLGGGFNGVILLRTSMFVHDNIYIYIIYILFIIYIWFWLYSGLADLLRVVVGARLRGVCHIVWHSTSFTQHSRVVAADELPELKMGTIH